MANSRGKWAELWRVSSFLKDNRGTKCLERVLRQAGFDIRVLFFRDQKVGIVNFQGDPALAVKEINAWLFRVTGHKMSGLASVEDVSLSTRVLMVGTSFMRCLWLDKFSELYTAPMPFFADDGKINVPTMCSRRICNYCHVERLACHVLELPCMMEDLQLLILLPDVQSDLAYIEANITPRDVQEFERRYTRNPLDITLPKFVLDEHVSMARYLAAVGVRDLFNKEEADLTGISGGFAGPAPSDDNIRQPEPQKWSAPNIVTKALEEQAGETSLWRQRALISIQLAMPPLR